MSGELPPELGNLSSLTQLGLGKNYLSGEIPQELGNLLNLEMLLLGSNQLSGEVPPELGSLPAWYRCASTEESVERVRTERSPIRAAE